MSAKLRPVKLALPKGSLQKTTAAFLARAGVHVADYGEGSRSYRPKIDVEGVEVKVLRPQEIRHLVCLSGAFLFLELTIGPIWAIPMDIAPSYSGTASGLMNSGVRWSAPPGDFTSTR